MGRYYCNGKKGYCDRFVGNIQNAENIDCKDCEYADGSGGEYKDIVTNYDRIKSMSVKEMAVFIRKIQDETIQKFRNFIMPPYTYETEQWLLQEVRDEK